MSMQSIRSYQSRMTHEKFFPAARDAAEVARAFNDLTDGNAEVLRWKSNNQCPMDDMLAAWLVIGVISEAQAEATTSARQVDTDAFLAAYRANPPQRSAEDLAEMRAAFGSGAQVVDIASGQRYSL